MIRTSLLRKSHRVLGVVIGIQVLIWTISGAIFVWNDIESVRGDDMRVAPDPITMQSDWVSPTAIDLADRIDPQRITGFDLVRVDEDTCYRIRDAEGSVVLADVLTGAVREPLTRDEAVRIALASFAEEVTVSSAALVTADEVGSHHEYRGGDLPAWMVQLDHPSQTRIYVSQAGGTVTRHRNRTWRVFDFFWMLHTMDYRARDDFNHGLIKTISLAAMALAISGYFLFGRTSTSLRRRR